MSPYLVIVISGGVEGEERKAEAEKCLCHSQPVNSEPTLTAHSISIPAFGQCQRPSGIRWDDTKPNYYAIIVRDIFADVSEKFTVQVNSVKLIAATAK